MRISNKILSNLIPGYEISSYVDKSSIARRLSVKKQIVVKYLYTRHSQKSISRSDEILVVQI